MQSKQFHLLHVQTFVGYWNLDYIMYVELSNSIFAIGYYIIDYTLAIKH